MNTAALEDTIYDRLVGDTGSGGLLATGSELVSNVYNHMRNPSDTLSDKPYIVFAVDDWTQDETYDTSGITVDFTVHIFGAPRGGTTVFRNVINRVFGDWKPTTAPSFGLHRWAAGSLGGNLTMTQCFRVGGGSDHTDDAYHYVERYKAFVTDTRA